MVTLSVDRKMKSNQTMLKNKQCKLLYQMGVEYQLQPTEEQVSLYHKMVDWGADIIFGGHPCDTTI